MHIFHILAVLAERNILEFRVFSVWIPESASFLLIRNCSGLCSRRQNEITMFGAGSLKKKIFATVVLFLCVSHLPDIFVCSWRGNLGTVELNCNIQLGKKLSF